MLCSVALQKILQNNNKSWGQMMRKYSMLIFIAILAFCTFNVAAEDEKPIFESLRCGLCHKADTGKSNPSLMEITKAYNGDNEKLSGYLQGNNPPIVNPERGKTMEKYIDKTKTLTGDEIKSLVDFILSNK
jgi:cytochrome c551/c552